MNSAHQPWDRALVHWLGRVGQRWSGRAVFAVVLSLVAALAPGPAQADPGPPGLNDAQINLTSDGYPPDAEWRTFRLIEVSGENFAPNNVAQIFLCYEGAVDLHSECQPLGVAPTDTSGSFKPTSIHVTTNPQSAKANYVTGAGPSCAGFTGVQCEVVAVTYDPITGAPNAKATHYVCFVYSWGGGGFCKPKPTGDWSTTTTTIDPYNNEQLSMSEDGYAPGDPLKQVAPLPQATQTSGASRSLPITVTGAGFPPLDVVELFVCRAGITADLHVHCRPLGTASTTGPNETSPGGEFTATVSIQTGWHVPAGSEGYSGGTVCRGIDSAASAQCALVAAVFDHSDPGVNFAVEIGTWRPIARADNYICFEGPRGCDPKPGTVVSTTTTTTSTTVVPPPITHNVADFDGNGSSDVSVFRPADGTWYVKDGAWSQWGQNGDIPVPADYDGDGATDVAIFRPETGLWAIHHSGGGPDLIMTYGIATDVPVPADYDGDKKADIAVFRPEYATWWVHRSSDGADTATTFGISTDIPTPGHYDGDDKADLSVFRPESGTWYVAPSTGGNYTSANWGIAGDVPVPADYDADPAETTEFAVFRPSTGAWYVYGQGPLAHGASGDVPVPGHYDTDPSVDAAVFRPSTGEWLIHGQPSASWGGSGDIPLPLPAATYQRFFATASG